MGLWEGEEPQLGWLESEGGVGGALGFKGW